MPCLNEKEFKLMKLEIFNAQNSNIFDLKRCDHKNIKRLTKT